MVTERPNVYYYPGSCDAEALSRLAKRKSVVTYVIPPYNSFGAASRAAPFVLYRIRKAPK